MENHRNIETDPFATSCASIISGVISIGPGDGPSIVSSQFLFRYFGSKIQMVLWKFFAHAGDSADLEFGHVGYRF